MDVVRKPKETNGQDDGEQISVNRPSLNTADVTASEQHHNNSEVEAESSVNEEKNDVEKDKKPKGKVPKFALYIVYAVLVIALMAVAGYFYNRYNDLKMNPKAAISKNNQAETNRVLEKLKKVLFIGETEAPTVARVEEPDKLKSSNPEFYKDIQTGDYLIIYPKRAIIYREQENQIINFAPIINTKDLEQTSNAEEPAEETPAPATQKTTR